MRSRNILRAALVIAACPWAAPLAARQAKPSSPPNGGIPPERFEKLHALIQPQADEWKWAKLPWAPSLWDARKRAADEGKPIFLFSMGGEPLGQS